MALDVGFRRLRSAVAERGAAPRVVIVGAGLSGLASAIRLSQAGITDITVLEQSDNVGGTWHDNTYPGASCDVPSHLYSFSFAKKNDWSRRFALQPEILGYVESLVDRFGLGRFLTFGATVTSAAFDETAEEWEVHWRDRDGHDHVQRSDALIVACGQLNRPSIPDFEGLSDFEGPMWHSARWNHDVDLSGRHVGIVGTGASAIQFVPEVAKVAERVTIFQRSPNYVAPKKDRAYEGLERRVLARSRLVETLYRWNIYLQLEARWPFIRRATGIGTKLAELFAKQLRASGITKKVADAAVVPDYPIGCKRILLSSDWYPTLMRENVEVVTDPIARIEPDAVVCGSSGRHPVDTLVFGTGFATTDMLSHLDITGRSGESLAERWKDGAHAYLGIAVAGFPNMFLLYGPNTNLGHNSILFMVERQLNWILQAMARSVRTGEAVDVKEAAYRSDDEWTQRSLGATAWAGTCSSWYKDAKGRITNNWPTWTVAYWARTLLVKDRDLDLVAPRAAAPLGEAVASNGVATVSGHAPTRSRPSRA